MALWKSQISIDRLIPVSERTFREVTIQSLDHRCAGQRGADMRGLNKTWTEIGRVRSNRHVCFIGGFNYVPHDRNSSDLGNARLDVVHRPAFDQPRKIGRRQDIFTDGDWHAAGADLPRGVKSSSGQTGSSIHLRRSSRNGAIADNASCNVQGALTSTISEPPLCCRSSCAAAVISSRPVSCTLSSLYPRQSASSQYFTTTGVSAYLRRLA